jgi:NAD(P)H dehydrogenase (quinone)
MKVLIVLAHPEPNGKSFNHAMVEIAASALGEQGHEVRINDLYANGFNPVGGPWEFETLPDPDRFEYMAAQGHAEETGTKHADVVAEQEKLLWCDLLILQFPLWWFGMPGILKGWIDRVMSNGLAYDNPGAYEKGGFRGRRATIVTSTATEPEYYALRGRGGYMSHLLWPINNGVLRYVGFDVLPYFIADEVGAYAGGVPEEDAACRKILADYRVHVQGLESAEPCFFHPREDYEADRMRLKPEIEARTEMQNPDLLKKNNPGG